MCCSNKGKCSHWLIDKRVALTKENGKICGQLINGKNATNLKVHLQTHHTESFKEFVGKDNKRSLKSKYQDEISR